MTFHKIIRLIALLALTAPPLHAKTVRGSKAPPLQQERLQQEPLQQEPLQNDQPNLLQDKLPDTPKHVLACDAGAFAKDSSHSKLAAEFGAKNVAFKDVDEAGRKEKATVLFDDDPTRRAVVFWRDAAAKANPVMIVIGAPSTWIGPGGIHNGLPMKEVEKLGGGAFKLTGFDGKNPGLTTGLKGALAAPAGGCRLSVRFEPGIANPLPEKFAAITGDKDVISSNPLMRRARPQVSEWMVRYQ